jgi:hypothetical protein
MADAAPEEEEKPVFKPVKPAKPTRPKKPKEPEGIRPWQILAGLSALLLVGAYVIAMRSINEETESESERPKVEKPQPTPENYKLEGKPLSMWVADLKGDDAKVRRDAAMTLITVDKTDGAPLLAPLLLETLKDERADVRGLSAYVLGYLRSDLDGVIPALGTALHDKVRGVREAAAKALILLGRSNPEAIAVTVNRAIGDDDPDVRRLAKYIKNNTRVVEVAPDPRKPDKPDRPDGPPRRPEIRDDVVGKTAPEIQAEDLDGVRFKLSDFRGKVVVLTFWAEY